MGRDFTIFAVAEGKVKYQKGRGDRVYVHVEPVAKA
jgi:ribosomal protein L27